MANPVAGLYVDLKAEVAGFKSDLGKAVTAVGQFEQTVNRRLGLVDKTFATLGSAVKGFAAGIAAVGVVGAVSGLTNFARASIEAVGALGELAEQVGIDVERLQEFQFAAAQSGVASENLEQGFVKLADKIGEAAKENDQAIESFDAIGVKIFATGGKLKSTEEIFLLVADAISKIDEPARRTQALIDIFGKSGAKLAPLLAQGSAGLQEFARQARELGLVMDGSLVKRADEAGDRFDALTSSIGSNLRKAVVTAALPALESLNRTLQQTLEMVGGSGGLVGKIRELDLEWTASIRRSFADTFGKLPGMGFLEEEAREAEGRLAELRANQRRLEAEREGARPVGEPLKIDIGGSNPKGKAARAREDAAAAKSFAETMQFLIKQEQENEKVVADSTEAMRKREEGRRETIASIEEEVVQNDLLLAALRQGAEAYQVQKAEIEILNRMKRDGIPITQEEIAKARELAVTLGKQNEEEERILEEEKARAAVRADITKTVGTAFEDMLLRSGKVGDGFRGLLEDIQRQILRTFVTKPLQNFLDEFLKTAFTINNTQISPQVSGGGGSSGGGGIFGTILGAVGSFFGGGMGGGGGWSSVSNVGFTGAGSFAGSFADGGSFTVGGRGGIDQNLVSMNLSRGERVDITPANDMGGGGGTTINIDARGATEDGMKEAFRQIRRLEASMPDVAVRAARADRTRNPRAWSR